MNDYIFTTLRCGIREITDTDIPAEVELYSGPHMTEYIPPLSDPEREAELCIEYAVQIYDRFGYGMWGIFDPDTGRLIGEAGLEPRADTDRAKYPYDWMFDAHCAELGFCIAEDLWGRGYCKEVCRGILNYCRDRFGITEVFARTAPENIASVHVLKSLGFEICGQSRSEDGCVSDIYHLDAVKGDPTV